MTGRQLRRGGSAQGRWLRALLTGLLAALLTLALSGLGWLAPVLATPGASAWPGTAVGSTRGGGTVIPINEQPFYAELIRTAERWNNAPLGQVVGESPRETILNFYAVMARVNHELEVATERPQQDPGWFWSRATRQRIRSAEELFQLAVQALDSSEIPESIRDDQAEEAAIQLKEVLDFVFSHSSVPIAIPDSTDLKTLNNQRNKSRDSWTLPNTAITLTSEVEQREANIDFLFSASTVNQIGRMYAQIRDAAAVAQPFATPNFYQNFNNTPGYLAPPKWYLRLPAGLRQVLELSLADQTLFQFLAAAAMLLVYGWVVLALFRRLLHTYRYYRSRELPGLPTWQQDNVAWTRVLLTLPVMPLTWLSDLVIDDLVNFTGLPLRVVTYLFFICNFLAASIFFFFLFEALGRSLAEWLVLLRGGNSKLQLRRVSNLVMPVCRVLGGVVALVLIYWLLITLGLPSTTVLAFSAVPGLAIGLGASKLLGNLFAGLSIQTDRPVRVGEFCRIGDNLGFVTRIGLRSLELQTLESRVTIPNAIADDETIVNYSRRQRSSEAVARQSLALRLAVHHPFSPEQVADLLRFVRQHLDGLQKLQEPLVSLEQDGMEQFTLLCHGLVEQSDWPGYLSLRETLLLRLEEIVEQVRLSQRQIGVSYDTRPEQLQRIPELIADVVNRDPLLSLQSCRLMTISEFSYDYSFRFHGHHESFGRFKDAIHRLNKDLLACFAAEDIEIPYPTAVEIQKDA